MRTRILTALAVASLAGTSVLASSHREAPFVTEIPKVDGTDFYMFNAYEAGQSDNVVLVANYIPLQAPYGGPNYFTMDPEAVYDIHISNDDDAQEDITFRFRFDSVLRDIQLPVGAPGEEIMVSVPLTNIGPVSAADDSQQNVLETFTVELIEGNASTGKAGTLLRNGVTGETTFAKPLDNIGTKSIPDYAAYASSFVYAIDLPGGAQGRMFVGQRKDPFVVNLGETFDLVNLNPLGAVDGESDDLDDANVTSLILEIPADSLTGDTSVIGGWTTAKLPRRRVLSKSPTFESPSSEKQGVKRLSQVSRLGMPLVNEVVIGLPDKNRFNASSPADDAQFLDYVTNPTLPELLEILFGVQAPDLFPREDLVAAFLTGFDGLNDTPYAAEMLRLNTAIPPVDAASQSNLGVLGDDLAGFPNGRRPGDDVVDITLRVAMGVLVVPLLAPDGQLPFTDGAVVDASFFDESFPYLRDPLPGSPQD